MVEQPPNAVSEEQEVAAELVQRHKENADVMLEVLGNEAYDEYANEQTDDALKSLVRRAAQGAVARLTETSLDYAVEVFGRHHLTEPEFDRVVGDITALTPEQAEERLRFTHVALEVIRAEGAIPTEESEDIQDESRAKVVEISTLIETIQKVEAIIQEPLDAEGFLQFADTYHLYLMTSIHDQETDEARMVKASELLFVSLDDRLSALGEASREQLVAFAKDSHYNTGMHA